MPYHEWGSDFDFGRLNDAASWVENFYRRMTGNMVVWKEKYGTVRYEFTHSWLKSNKHVEIMCEILRRACYKFPDMAKELIEDWVICLNKPKTVLMAYYVGFFTGINIPGWWPNLRPYKPHKSDGGYYKYNIEDDNA